MNTRLSLSLRPPERAWTGNVYELKSDSLYKAFDRAYPVSSFRKDFATAIGQGLGQSDSSDAAILEERKKKIDEICDAVLSTVLVEVNPPCDHAQDKTECGRLLVGVRIKASMYDSNRVNKKVANIWAFGPLFDESSQEPYYMLFDLRRPLVVTRDELVSANPPWARIRQSVAVDLLAHVSGHGGRPGFLRLTGR